MNVRNFTKKVRTMISNADVQATSDKNMKYTSVYEYMDMTHNLSGEKHATFDGGSKYQQINHEYLISKDEDYFFPTNNSTAYSRTGNTVVQSEYYSALFINEEIEYPLTQVNESIVLDSSSFIRDKYITVGMNGSTESSALLAGTDRLQFVDPNNNLVAAQYITIIEIDLPDINSSYVVSSNFYFSKNTTTTNSNRNPNISLNKITSNIDYDNIEGTTSFNRTLIGTGLGSLYSYCFDITNYVVSSIDSNGKLLLTIEGSLNGYASFYSTNSNSMFSPYLTLEVTPNALGGTLFGDAPAYVEVDKGITNCFGYVLLADHIVDMKLTSGIYSNVFEVIEQIIKSYGYEVRQISSYDSDIYADERRIAFMYNPRNLSEWHFMMQNSDGGWSSVQGYDGFCVQHSSNPSNTNMWGALGEYGLLYYYALK